MLPALLVESDGTASPDAALALGPKDRMVLEACGAKLRACQACIDRGRKAGVVR